ncbi:copper-binding protein [Primorskyibacter sp. 2E233]|uniref:copper-binding protein n=1 Tax=Primorskyibacter sp. 2E233 TaxID=3413431 RepID=UPI003BF35495
MKNLITVLALGLMTATAALAQDAMPMSQGTITKIDTKWKKVTIDHGPLENLDMPAMKMVFAYEDGMMEGLAEGAKVVFVADRLNGKLSVTEITAE